LLVFVLFLTVQICDHPGVHFSHATGQGHNSA